MICGSCSNFSPFVPANRKGKMQSFDTSQPCRVDKISTCQRAQSWWGAKTREMSTTSLAMRHATERPASELCAALPTRQRMQLFDGSRHEHVV